MSRAGRFCPPRYRYGAQALAIAPEEAAETLYVIGGLYGNLPALEAIEELAAAEPEPVRLLFNGDFNWFNADPVPFDAVNRRVLAHGAILGNVEAELAGNGEAGCGCAYPDGVDDVTVARSNLIHSRLRETAAAFPDIVACLSTLAMYAILRIGAHRVAVVHGDADSLAGWGFDHAVLEHPGHAAWLARCFADANVDVFASSHTCLPVCRGFELAHRPRAVINNGAAGMPNFRGERSGVISRIACSPSPHTTLYGLRVGELHLDALRVTYDHDAWITQFLAQWPPGSPAHASYFERIKDGPDHSAAAAAPPIRSCPVNTGQPRRITL